MAKMQDQIIELLKVIKNNDLLFPSTWSDTRITLDENKFRTYLDGNRTYISCEVTYKDGKAIKFTINDNTVAIESPIKTPYTLKDVVAALKLIVDYEQNRDWESEKARVVSQIVYYKNQLKDTKLKIKELEARKAEIVTGIKKSEEGEA